MILNSETNVFDAISNQTRREILHHINKKNQKSFNLSKKLGISIQTLIKHRKKLIDSGLIVNNNNVLMLTELGYGVINQVISLEFLENNKEFFSKYSLSYFPREFVMRIGELSCFEKVVGYVATIERYKQLLKETKKFAKIIAPQVSLDIYRYGMKLLQTNDVDVYYILGTNAIIPKGWSLLQKNLNEDKMVSQGKLHRRMIEKAHVMLYLSENHAFLAFPNKEGIADPGIMLTSKDEKFRKWCLDYFDWQWKNSTTFLKSKIEER